MTSTAVRMRSWRGPALLSAPFRPFFLMPPIWAAVMAPLWAWIYAGGAGVVVTPAWHAHEMLFGYLAGVMAGFLLNFVPNWSGRLPVSGGPLLMLAGLWTAGRVIMLTPGAAAPVQGVIDCAYLAALAFCLWREIATGKSGRNLPVALIVSAFALCNVAYHFASPETAVRLALSVVLVLFAFVGGKLIPSFTANHLKKRGYAVMPAPPDIFDVLIMAATLAGLAAWALEVQKLAAGVVLCLSGALNVLRLGRWRGIAALNDPLVLSMHVAYFWYCAGLVLLGMAVLGQVVVMPGAGIPMEAGVHALTVGSLAAMTLAVMMRHLTTRMDRSAHTEVMTAGVNVLINLSALARVVASLLPGGRSMALGLSSAAWFGAFVLFAMAFGSALVLKGRKPAASVRPASD